MVMKNRTIKKSNLRGGFICKLFGLIWVYLRGIDVN